MIKIVVDETKLLGFRIATLGIDAGAATAKIGAKLGSKGGGGGVAGQRLV